MRKLHILCLLITLVSNAFAYEYIPFTQSYELDEDDYELNFTDLTVYMGANYSEERVENAGEWVQSDDLSSNDFLDYNYFWIRVVLPDRNAFSGNEETSEDEALETDDELIFGEERVGGEDEENEEDTLLSIEEPILVLQLHSHTVDVYLNGEKLEFTPQKNINNYSVIFIPIEEALPGDVLYLKFNSNIHGSRTMSIADSSVVLNNPGKYSLQPFIAEGVDFIISILFLFVGFLSLIFFLANRKEEVRYILWFALFSLLLSLFHALSTDIVTTFIPISAKFKEIIEMMSFDLLSIILILFYISYFTDSWRKYFYYFITGHLVIVIMNLLGNITGYYLSEREIISYIYPACEYLFIWIHLMVKVKHVFPSGYFKLAFITIALTYFSQYEIVTGDYLVDLFLNAGLVLFFSILALVPIQSYIRQGKLIREQNIVFKKFVPEEFLRFLSRDNITQIKLGDQIEQEMSILFTDIRSFTSISEKMNPKEIFNYLNSYLEHIGPVIRKNNGFIDKYIGDAVMALFPGSPSDAVRAAIEMLETVEKYNKTIKGPLMKIGIGIHTGKTMLGIIGEFERIESTVISDAVNTASRLEGLTKELKHPIVFSETVANYISDEFQIKSLGEIKVRGKEKSMKVYTCIL